jgi:hypothetical protein
LAILLVGLLAAGSALAADGPSPADRQLLLAYQLTMDKLRHFGAADKALYDDAAKDPALKGEIARMAEEAPQATLADLQAKLARHPRVAAYYTKEGLTNQEAIVIPLATMGAMGVVLNRGAGPASPDQIAFVRQHQAEVQAMLDQWFREDGDD